MINQLAERLTQRSLDNTKSRVNDPRRARRIMIVELALFVGAMIAGFARGWTDEHWLDVAATMFVSGLVGLWAFGTTRRSIAYQHGWVDGRQQMIGALAEAQRRDIDLVQWVHGEWLRTASVLGVDPNLPERESDDDERE